MRFPIQTIDIPWAAWHQEQVENIDIPLSFEVDILTPRGGDRLSESQIRQALDSPVGSCPLKEMAQGRSSVCIAVDDLTRPTRAYEILPYLLEPLHQAGLASRQICIVIATGSHAALSPGELSMKVGHAVASRYRVLVHNCREGLSGTGVQYGENELLLNSAFYDADFRITLGSVLPHSFAGYSGGAKMVIPGLADINAIRRSHKRVQLVRRQTEDVNNNIFRSEAEALVQRIGIDFSVNVVTNIRRETVSLIAGDIVTAHRAACGTARQVYGTNLRRTYDIALVNSYPKDGDLVQAATSLIPFKGLSQPMVNEGGLYLLTSATCQGIGEHGVYGADVAVRQPGPLRILEGRDLWLYTPLLTEREVHSLFCDQYRVFQSRQELASALDERFPDGAALACLPCAPMQQINDLRWS